MSGPVERGPNYDWKHEARHYQDECDSLRALLRKVENSGDRYAWERDQLKKALEQINGIPDWRNDEASAIAAVALRSIQEVQPGSQPTTSPEASRGAGPEGTQAPDCGQDVSSKVTRDTHQERILKSAVAMSRAVIGMLTSLCSKKALRQIYGGDVKDVFRTQERLEEAWKLLDPIGAKMESYHGCFTGDCPHDKQEECDADIAKHRAELEAEAAQSPLPVTQTVPKFPDLLERLREYVDAMESHGCSTGDCPHEKQTECDADLASFAAQVRKELSDVAPADYNAGVAAAWAVCEAEAKRYMQAPVCVEHAVAAQGCAKRIQELYRGDVSRLATKGDPIMDIKKLVDRFLTWPVPKSVRPDPVIADPKIRASYPHEVTGTSILDADEAEQMLRHVLQDVSLLETPDYDEGQAHMYNDIYEWLLKQDGAIAEKLRRTFHTSDDTRETP